ncbi:hypothetical protein EDB81DRAFT_940196 [Dactylonectria macrodidyma]|uniref:T6SS Phospholipase effector Tle1-like catalytic domain-containing protein n=1 Tax=Dactylonectria macrodidyma TaxID=307937 RepID=A0A9P9FVT5_9HYPO|nr:hypothetical protein EDB81DRAFT_940196 [Dactylonectria macrodidyma]
MANYPKPLIVLCDGTWAGRETNTRTNIYFLAKMVGIDIDNPTDTDIHVLDGSAWYMHGVGLGSTFLDYVFNGLTAQDIADQCIAAYRFIVDNYSYPDRQLWMFGFSRGAFLVRSVAGMINNCGIVKPVMNDDGNVNEDQTSLLCQHVYKIYRSDDPIHDPHSAQSRAFRRNASWPLIGDEALSDPPLIPPVKFIGAFDTVGSLGIPDFVGGVGLDWPQFHDQNVSTVVELVYHAICLHERLYIFPPCHARRNPNPERPKDFGITEKWFPGVHYDLGRQRFRFLRAFGGGWLERLLSRWDWASREVQPNEVLADLGLKWMLEAVQANDPAGKVIPALKMKQEIEAANQRMIQESRQTGSGDIYENVVGYFPFGRLIVSAFTALWGTRWQRNEIYQLVLAIRPRVVADLNSPVYDFMKADASITGAGIQTIETLAGIDSTRYPSDTFEDWELSRTFR